jgi:hypothetical protein
VDVHLLHVLPGTDRYQKCTCSPKANQISQAGVHFVNIHLRHRQKSQVHLVHVPTRHRKL